MDIFLCIIFIIPMLLAEHKVVRVNTCPQDSKQWFRKAKEFNCPQGKTYHCLLSFNSSLYEVCMYMKVLGQNKEGCPWISFHNGEPILGGTHTKCPITSKECPSSHKGYTSDQLYQYPLCFIPENERDRYVLSTEASDEKEHYDTKSKENSSSTWQYIAIVVLLLLPVVLILSFVLILKQRRRNIQLRERIYLRIQNTGSDENIRHQGCADSDYPKGEQEDHHQHAFVETKYYREMYRTLQTGRTVWLCGIYGSGKTRCAKHYASSTESSFIKINCLDANTFQKGVNELIKNQHENPDNCDDPESVENYGFNHLADVLVSKQRQKDSIPNTIVLFYHVTDETSSQVKKSATAILENNGFKCIATSFDHNVFSHHDGPFNETVSIRCDEGFTDQESVQFFDDRIRNEEDRQAVRNFNRDFDGHPLTLAAAKSKMSELHETPAEFLNKFKGTVHFEKSIVSDEFKAMLTFLQGKTDNVAIIKLFKMVQFLQCSEIPLHIFRHLFDGKEISLSSLDSFVTFIQQNSFGNVIGTGDTRMINIHKAVQILLRTNTDRTEQSNLLLQMLMTLNCLLSTDQSCSSVRERCIGLLQHATETITVAQDLQFTQEQCLEKQFAIILLCEKVSYTYKLDGDFEKHAKYVKIAIDICHKTIPKMEYDKLEQPVHEDGCKSYAAQIFEDVQRKLSDSNTLMDMIKQYSLRKLRSKSLITELHLVSGMKNDREKFHLTEDDYEKLERNGYAVKRDNLARNSLTELIVNIFLSFGILPMSKQFDYLDGFAKVKCTTYVYVAYYLAKFLSKLQPSCVPLCRVRVEINGKMEVLLTDCEREFFDKDQKLTNENTKELENLCRKLNERMGDTNRRFFVHGVYVLNISSPEIDIIFRRQMFRCCALLSSQTPQKVSKEKLTEQEGKVKDILSNPHYQNAESLPLLRQTLAFHYVRSENWIEASKILGEGPLFDFDSADHALREYDISILEMRLKVMKKSENKASIQRLLSHFENGSSKTFATPIVELLFHAAIQPYK